MSNDNEDYALLDRAWTALDEGEAQLALEIADEADDELPETWVLRATAFLDLDDLDAARAAAEQAAEREDENEDAELLVVRAEIDLRDWEFDAARERLERAHAKAKLPAVMAKLALLADLEGDYGRADRMLRDAQRLDAQNFPFPPRLNERELDLVTKEAIAKLPETFRRALERVAVIVEAMPNRALAGDEPRETPPDLLGLFTGASLAEQADDEGFALPPTIHVFQRNVERACTSRKELVEELRITLYHELGHYLGFDEHGVDELGLG